MDTETFEIDVDPRDASFLLDMAREIELETGERLESLITRIMIGGILNQ